MNKKDQQYLIYKEFFDRVSDYPKNAAPPYNGLDYIKARIYDAQYQLDFLERDPMPSESYLERPV